MTGRRLGRFGAAAAAIVVGLVSAVAAAGPAYAGVSGQGWSGSWNYYTSTSYEVHLTLPGGQVDAYGPDDGGQRRIDAAVTDTNARDRVCVRMRIIATDGGSLGSQTACDGGTEVINSAFFSGAVFVHIDLMTGNVIGKSAFTFVPSSVSDATLRTVGSGTSWAYINAGQYHLEVHRPGVDVVGDGIVQAGGERSVGATVSDTGVAGSCVEGRAFDAAITVIGTTCGPGTFDGFASFDFNGYIKIMGCYASPTDVSRCLTMHFPEPY